ncbi:MAG: CDP-diacylglycerol--glycerol-3-phosphate 3-phosphatidyltransferase, partial [Clostridiales bacterium]|nr:CDP-diacylglycerol--glycerol-3-phosphate 3-phosphatidyltransferase [Clostridiales bacterium]
MNLPNRITIARMCMIPLFLAALLGGFLPPNVSRLSATGIFIIASASDWLDGFLARKMDLISDFGKLMDPIADKLLVGAALVSMVQLGDIDAWMVVLIISREFLISGMRLVAVEKGNVIAASTWAKIKTAIQMLMIIMVLGGGALLPEGQSQVFSAVCELMKWLAVGLTVISAYDYIYKNRELFK